MRKVNSKKIIVILIILIAAVTYFSLRGCSKNGGTAYRYEKVTVGEVKKTISTTGTLEVAGSQMVLSKVNGLVTNVYADFNDAVRVNQLLAALDTTEIDQEIIKIDSRRESLAFDLLAAKKDVNAKKDMLKENLISAKSLEQAELEYKKIDIQFKQIQNEYEIAKKNKNYRKIFAPISGVIIDMDIKPNVPITANKVLFVIAEDLMKMRLIIQVDESDIGAIKKDQRVTFSVSAFPEKTFEGRISQVRLNPIRRDQIVAYQALISCENRIENGQILLRPGLTATATVETGIRNNVLRVPSEAFYIAPAGMENKAGKKILWKKQAVTMESIPVKGVEVNTGLIGDYFTEIISDKIKAGDEILVGANKGSGDASDLLGK